MANPKRLPKPPSQRGNRAERSERYDHTASANDIGFIARHEAGHAVAAVVLKLPLVSTDIKRRPMPGGVSLGYTKCPVEMRPWPRGREWAMPYLIQNLAGPIAELGINPGLIEDGGDEQDRADAFQIAAVGLCEGTLVDGRFQITPEEQEERRGDILDLIHDATMRASDLVNEHAVAIGRVTAALLRRQSLTGEDVARLMAFAQTSPPQ